MTKPTLHALALAILAACSLTACAFTFGEDPSPQSLSPEEARRRSQRLFIEEQERLERQRQSFGGASPSER